MIKQNTTNKKMIIYFPNGEYLITLNPGEQINLNDAYEIYQQIIENEKNFKTLTVRKKIRKKL